jgi:hypothetical protein
MIPALDAGKRVRFITTSDSKSSEPTVFVLRPLTAREWATFDTGRVPIVDVLRFGVVEVENFAVPLRGGDGKVTDAFLDALPFAEAAEVAAQIVKLSRMEDDDRKNS